MICRRLATLIIVLCTGYAHSSLCVVTKWDAWSECTGSCQFALQVRNRNVLRPPFPEIDQKTGEKFTRPCPVLYETRECQPTECLSKERAEKSTTTTTTQPPHIAAAMNELLRDLPIIRSVTSDTAKSPFESDKIASRPSWKKTAIERPRVETPTRRVAQAHRPNCTFEMNSQCCRLVREECPDRSTPTRLIRWFRLPGEQLCRPFHYPHCSEQIARQEKPLLTEGACLQLCFSDYEKAILPSLRII